MSAPIIEKIRAEEAKLDAEEAKHSEMLLALAADYRALVTETGSARKAAKLAKAEGLRYADTSNLGKLIAWLDLVEAISGGGVHLYTPPFTEGQIRPLLSRHFTDNAGPGGLADIWEELTEQTPKAFIAAAREAYPKPATKLNGKQRAADDARLRKVIGRTQKTWGKSMAPEIILPTLFDAIGPADDRLALALVEAIQDKWGSVDKFRQQAKEAAKNRADDQRQVSEALGHSTSRRRRR